LSQLYDMPNTHSIVSTHYKDLAIEFSTAKRASALQLLADEDTDGKLSYTYTVAHGISDKSSVMEILRERGLLARI
jgi:DNA mismatch repair ATPase MutS